MNEKYAPLEVEQEVQHLWEEHGSFIVRDDDSRPKYYSLCMWPYPSGDLHVGHLRNYTIGDVWARHKRMQGHNVLQPMGWDAFGKDAELKAHKIGLHPAKWVASNTANMKRELKALGFMIDWQRELASCNPAYYHWEQVLFVRMWAKGLIYHSPTKVLWDQVTKTVISRRDIDDGKVAKGNVEIKNMDAYQMGMRKYADELLTGLTTIKWPDKIVKDQQYLIGRSDGMTLKFPLLQATAGINALEVYTTRPDTVMGVTYMAVHANHPLARHAASNDSALANFCQQCSQVLPMDAGNPESDKAGMPLGIDVVNPINNHPVPVWVADYVVDDYGSGALMGVPAHDERDFNFASRYGLPIIRVTAPTSSGTDLPLPCADTELGVAVNSGPLDGLDQAGCITKLEELLGSQGLAWRDHGLSLRDWPINRRMYWGTPIPIIKCKTCGLVPVPESDLPVRLPLNINSHDELAQHPDFVSVTCPQCGAAARREHDTMDTFVNSAWYYARFTCRDATDKILDNRAHHWLPCDHYFGGDEHAQGHLVYARFIHKVLRDLDILPANCGDEPFKALLCQGMVLGPDGKKMSKSQDNTVMAKDILDSYGADVARMYIIGIGNPKDSFAWDDMAVRSQAKFLDSLWNLAITRRDTVMAGADQEPTAAHLLELRRLLHNIDHNLVEQKLNNLVYSGIRPIHNLIKDNPDDAGFQHTGFSHLLKVLNLVSPHIAEKLWHELGFTGLLIDAPWWPAIAAADLADTNRLFVVQVNGKRRDQFEAPVTLADDEILERATQTQNTARYLKNMTIVTSKVIRQDTTHGIVFFVVKPPA